VDRRLLDGLVHGEVFLGDHAFVLGHELGEQPGGLAPVEAVVAVGLDASQGGGQVGLPERLAGLVQIGAVLEEGLARPGIHRVGVSLERLEPPLHGPGGREPVRREANRGLHDVGPRQRSELLMGHPHAGDGPRDPDGERPAVVRVVPDLPVLVQVHLVVGGERGLLAEVERGHVPVGAMVDHEPAAADVARRREGHREGERGRDGGVDRVAAPFEDVVPHLGREIVAAHDHPRAGRGGGTTALRERRSYGDPEGDRQGEDGS
jgi:hypothetical protein